DLLPRVLPARGRAGLRARRRPHGARPHRRHPASAAHPRQGAVKTSASELWLGRAVLVILMVITLVPFVTLFVTALHPTGTYPSGLSWPEEPQWSNFLSAFQAANMQKLLVSSVLIELGVVPLALLMST